MTKLKKFLKNLFSKKKEKKAEIIKDNSTKPLQLINEVIETCPCGKDKKDCKCGGKCGDSCHCKKDIITSKVAESTNIVTKNGVDHKKTPPAPKKPIAPKNPSVTLKKKKPKGKK